MLKHIVLFKLKPSAEGASKEDNSKKLKSALETLVGKIPQIRKLEVGINAIASDAAYDVAINSEFSDQNDLAIYAKHAEHVKVAEFIKKIIESRVVVDYIV
jgi:hypothetical protein